MRQRAARHDEQLEDVVEDGGIAPRLVDHGQDPAEILAEQRGGEGRFPGPHPVDVPAERVDLPVVRTDAERVRQVPGRKGVRAVPLMHNGIRAHEKLVFQVGVELGELRPREQPLVDERAARQAGDVELAGVPFDRGGGLLFRESPYRIKFPLERLPVVFPPGQEKLADLRARGGGEIPQDGGVDGNLAPAEDRAAFPFRYPLHRFGAFCRERRVGGEEDGPDGVLPGRGEVEPFAGADLAEKDVRDADHDAGAVAGGLVASQRTPVLEVDEHLDPLPYDEVQRHPVDPRDEAHAAAVVVVRRVVQPRRLRDARGVYAERVVLHPQRDLPKGNVVSLARQNQLWHGPGRLRRLPGRKRVGGKDNVASSVPLDMGAVRSPRKRPTTEGKSRKRPEGGRPPSGNGREEIVGRLQTIVGFQTNRLPAFRESGRRPGRGAWAGREPVAAPETAGIGPCPGGGGIQ